MKTSILITSPNLIARQDTLKNTITISLASDRVLEPHSIDLEIPCQIFEELINNISILAKRPEVRPEEISVETADKIAKKLETLAINASYNTIAKIISVVLNTDIKLVKKKEI